jgi:fucose permease
MSLCVTFYGMQIGRKGTILLGCVLLCIGALLQASTYSVGQIIAGRIVTGAGIGNIAAAVPTYMVCSKKKKKKKNSNCIATTADHHPRLRCRSRPKKEDPKSRINLLC